MTKPQAVILASVALWSVLWVRPAWLLPVGAATAVALGGLVGWGAIRYRAPGWVSGVLFAVLFLTIPLWVGVLMSAYQNR